MPAKRKKQKNIDIKLDYNRLLEICRLPDNKVFTWLLKQPELKTGETVTGISQLNNRKLYVFNKRGAKILGVAHTDTLLNAKWAEMIKRPDGEKIIFSPNLDDRVGVWLLLELSSVLSFDMVFTTDEESGQSTLSDWTANNDESLYNWAFEFDRGYEDVALYDFSYDEEWANVVEKYFGKADMGAFTDICELTDICAMNIGKMYEKAHTWECYTRSSWIEKAVRKFLKFYKKQQGMKYKHTPVYYGGYGYWRYEDDLYLPSRHTRSRKTNIGEYCSHCGVTLLPQETVNPLSLCENCAESQGMSLYCLDCGDFLRTREEMEAFTCYKCMEAWENYKQKGDVNEDK